MPPRDDVWEAKPHTIAKIEILREYLRVYFPILGQTYRNRTFLYIDGFAGPGEYKNHPDGSPVVALDAGIEAREYLGERWIAQDLHFAFIEKKASRLQNLQRRLLPYQNTPGVQLHFYNSEFVDGLEQIKKDLPYPFRSQDPLFAFIDPFGSKGVPFEVVQNLLASPTSEVLLYLDARGISRQFAAIATPGRTQHLLSFFNSEKWSKFYYLSHNERVAYVLELYVSELREIGTKYVFDFQMQDKNGQTSYYLVFASNHHRGLQEMKRSMVKVAGNGSYTFRDPSGKPKNVAPKSLFDEGEPDYFDPVPPAAEMARLFKGKAATYAELRDWVLNYTTLYSPRNVLKVLENEQKVRVELLPGCTMKKGDFVEAKIRLIHFAPFEATTGDY